MVNFCEAQRGYWWRKVSFAFSLLLWNLGLAAAAGLSSLGRSRKL